MNKFICILISSFLAFSSSITAIEEMHNFDIEFRTAAFFPSSNLFREIYGDVGASFQFETSFNWNCWNIWENIDWLSMHGKPIGCHGSTSINIFNVSAGIKFPYTVFDCLSIYAGIGPNIASVWLKNKTHCCHEKTSRLAIGAVFKTGVYYYITNNLSLEVFADYLYQPVHFEKWINMGGVKLGAGISWIDF